VSNDARDDIPGDFSTVNVPVRYQPQPVRWNDGSGSGSLALSGELSEGCHGVRVGWQALHDGAKGEPLLVDGECMGGEIAARSRRADDHHNLGPRITGDIGD
jgi:hypothetical protein